MRKLTVLLVMMLILALALPAWGGGPFNIRPPSGKTGIDPQAVTVVGAPQHHTTKKGEDLLDVARKYDLGWTEIGAMYRQWDPFLPPIGSEMAIPTMWIVPDSRGKQIIVNTGEM